MTNGHQYWGIGGGGEGGDSWVACITGEGHGSIPYPLPIPFQM